VTALTKHEQETLMRARPAVPPSTQRRGSVSLVCLLLLVMAVPGFAVAAKSKSNDFLFQVKGLSEREDGSHADPDGRVTFTVKRNARGIPTKVVDLKLSNVDTTCTRIVGDQYESVPGPELSANVGAIKLTHKKEQHGGGHYSLVFRFPNRPEFRTINGVEHQLFFLMDGKQAREASLGINASPATVRAGDGSCAVTVNEDVTRKK
jgi:hypothetical protein